VQLSYYSVNLFVVQRRRTCTRWPRQCEMAELPRANRPWTVDGRTTAHVSSATDVPLMGEIRRQRPPAASRQTRHRSVLSVARGQLHHKQWRSQPRGQLEDVPTHHLSSSRHVDLRKIDEKIFGTLYICTRLTRAIEHALVLTRLHVGYVDCYYSALVIKQALLHFTTWRDNSQHCS